MQPSDFNLSLSNININSSIFNFMKKLIVASVSIYMLFSLFSCNGNSQTIIGQGEIVTDKRNVGTFTGVSLEFSGDVMLKQSSETAVDVVAQANIAQEIETVVENNILHVRFKKRDYTNYKFDKLTVYVNTPTVETISLSGSGNLTALSDIKSNKLEVGLRGSGNIKLKYIDCTSSIDVHLKGSGNINMKSGTAQSAAYSVTGSGDIGADNLKAHTLEAKVTGSGNITCMATESISAKSTGSGNITYYGHPAQTMVSSTGSGSITSK